MIDESRIAVVELDLRGQICPATLLKSLREINAMREALKAGSTRLRILTDHRDATVTVPGAAGSMGYGASVVRSGAHYVITVESARD